MSSLRFCIYINVHINNASDLDYVRENKNRDRQNKQKEDLNHYVNPFSNQELKIHRFIYGLKIKKETWQTDEKKEKLTQDSTIFSPKSRILESTKVLQWQRQQRRKLEAELENFASLLKRKTRLMLCCTRLEGERGLAGRNGRGKI